MTIGMLIITHDEPTTLPRMLASVREIIDGPTLAFHIGDHHETEEILQAFDGAEVTRRDWRNFDGSWNELFALSRGRADRFLYMNANHILNTEETLPELGEVPCYMITYQRGGYYFRLANLLRGDIAWRINAPVHGFIEPAFFDERVNLDAISVYEDESDGRRPEKLARYLPLAEKMVEENPDNARAVFYLARTYFDFGRWEDAIAMYERRIGMGGWDEEVWHAHYMKGLSQIRAGMFVDGRLTLMGAYMRRPTRAEPLHAICKSMLPPDDLLFVEREIYGTPD